MPIMFKKNILLALATIKARRGRSVLTMLGVIVAVASVTVVLGIGHGIQNSVTDQTNQYSKNVITVRPAQFGDGARLSSLTGSAPRAALTDKDVQNITDIPTVRNAVPLSIVASSAEADHRFDGAVFAVPGELPEVLNQELAYGAFFTQSEESTNLAVLGADAAERMFDQRVPLGRTFMIRDQQYIVGGVLERFDATPFASSTNFNNALFVSDSSLPTLAPAGAPIYELLARVNNEANLGRADQAITNSLARSHGNRDDFNVLSPTELAGDTTATFDLLTTFVIAAAGITLLVSSIGIMNMMLVSVTERIHEIGIRKAVGATNKQVLDQFLTEAATISVIGSLLGVIVAFVSLWLLDAFTTLTPSYDWQAAGLVSLSSIVLGIVFGTLPAIKAARKDPIAALRSE